nr:hypothetical protein Q903MT_gene181 [Picea sitchensis]
MYISYRADHLTTPPWILFLEWENWVRGYIMLFPSPDEYPSTPPLRIQHVPQNHSVGRARIAANRKPEPLDNIIYSSRSFLTGYGYFLPIDPIHLFISAALELLCMQNKIRRIDMPLVLKGKKEGAIVPQTLYKQSPLIKIKAVWSILGNQKLDVL